MSATDQPFRGDLAHPDIRRELLLSLRELEAVDPRVGWKAERERGLVAGIDEVYHFFFDDHDFDDEAVGVILLDRAEAAAIARVQRALDAVLEIVGDARENDFVEHPLWRDVRSAAASASKQLGARN